MVDKIEVNINNIYKNVSFIIENNQLITKKYKKDIKSDLVDYLLNIIYLWNNHYLDSRYIDAEEFEIKIFYKNKIDIISGRGKYPSNYQQFKDWIMKVYE